MFVHLLSSLSRVRFHNWLVAAREWAISRNCFWGTPLPIWRSEDKEEVVVIGSIAELEDLTGQYSEHGFRHESAKYYRFTSSCVSYGVHVICA